MINIKEKDICMNKTNEIKDMNETLNLHVGILKSKISKDQQKINILYLKFYP